MVAAVVEEGVGKVMVGKAAACCACAACAMSCICCCCW